MENLVEIEIDLDEDVIDAVNEMVKRLNNVCIKNDKDPVHTFNSVVNLLKRSY